MKCAINKLYLMIGAAILVGLGLASWQFSPVTPLIPNQEPSSLQSGQSHSHSHEDEHGHVEENRVFLSEVQIKEMGIQTQEAGPQALAITLATRGKIILHPDKLAHILPKIPGVAKEARKNIGESVKEGEVLAVLESREMADSKANYLAAREKESLARSLFEREKSLYEKKVSAQQDFINAKSAYTESRINIQLAKQKLRAFGLSDKEIQELTNEDTQDLRLYDIRSPIHGMVISRHINRGEFIENTSTIYEIVDLSTVWVEIGIYPKDLVKVKEGQSVDVSLSTDSIDRAEGETAQAKIIYLSPIIQDETITAKAIAELKNVDGKWRPGSFVKVSIATENKMVPLAVPKESLVEIDGKEAVFVRVPGGFEKRDVQTGIRDDHHVEILKGLHSGEEYATSNTFLLKADLSKEEAEHEHG